MKRIGIILALVLGASGCGEPVEPPENPGDNSLAVITDAFDGVKRASTTYQLLVYSFCDSDGDGIGDFNGITSKLDYLDAMGVTALWLSPVQATGSYHGYDVDDYYALNPLFGTENDFKKMVDAAHAKGIKIYLDYVLNHSGSGNAWFKEAIANENSPYRDYYFISSNPGADYSKFPMLAGTTYNSGEWKSISTSSPVITISSTTEAVTNGNSSWNIWYWDSGSEGKTVKFVENGGNPYLVMDISGDCGMLVRKYPNWDSGSKYGAMPGNTTLVPGKPMTLVAEGADISFSGSGRYRIELSNVSGGGTVYYMGAFSTSMPDLNYGNPADFAASASFKDIAASADKWIKMGVDGLRLDAVKHICGGLSSWNNASNKAFLSAWYNHCNATYKAAGHNEDMYMVGEVFNEYDDSKCPYSTYLEALPSVFDFSFWWRLAETLNGTRTGRDFVNGMLSRQTVYAGERNVNSLKLSNHDEDRTGEVLGQSAAKEKQAGAILLTSPGKPYIYQGEELGYFGNKGGGDEYVRTPVNWDGGQWADARLGGKVIADLKGSAFSVKTQENDSASVLNVYKAFSRARNTYPALAEGSMSACTSIADASVAAWYMTDKAGQKMLVVHNVTAAVKTIPMTDDMSKPVVILGKAEKNGSKLVLDPYSSIVFKLY
ncbi:MAG: alpha-amylase [Bacteroidales bacterium]|nr:alpha-amylase [Bacteroidales bacterium]